MSRYTTLAICVWFFLAGASGWCIFGATPSTSEEQRQWSDRMIPLPKEFKAEQKLNLPCNQVQLRLAGNAGEVVQNAANEIKELFKSKANSDMNSGSFEIVIGVVDDKGMLGNLNLTKPATRLKELPNNSQAYIIFPNGENRLVAAGLTENGVYYAVKTLQQLLDWGFQNSSITIPLATITDWPDIEQRGYWDEGFSPKNIEKLAAVKYNTVHVSAVMGFNDLGQGVVTGLTPEDPKYKDGQNGFVQFCRLRGIKCIPYVRYFSSLRRTGLYDYHPELKGVGDSAASKRLSYIAPCTSQPGFAKVLSEWLIGIAAIPNVDEIEVRMSDEEVYCSCSRCLEQGEYLAQMRAAVNAWRMAQKVYPNLKMQLSLTQGSYPINDKILAEAPKDLRILYYSGPLTFNSSKEPMIYPLLEKYAADGGWLGVVPQVTMSWATIVPWSCPQFMKARMTEFADKKLHAVECYAHPAIHLFDYNVTAGGEWSWNSHGRNENQFTVAWATRKFFASPKQIAQWTDTLGPVSWNLYGSRFPYILYWEDAGKRITAKTPPPWGKDILQYFSGPEELDRNIRQCEAALELARKIDSVQLIEETQITLAYYNLLKTITQIMNCVSSNPTLSAAQKQQLRQYVDQLGDGTQKIATVLPQWSMRYGMSGREGRVANTIRDIKKITDSISKAVQDLSEK